MRVRDQAFCDELCKVARGPTKKELQEAYDSLKETSSDYKIPAAVGAVAAPAAGLLGALMKRKIKNFSMKRFLRKNPHLSQSKKRQLMHELYTGPVLAASNRGRGHFMSAAATPTSLAIDAIKGSAAGVGAQYARKKYQDQRSKVKPFVV